MGEVYRADDLKLGQPVALKFLPRDLANDPIRRERFLGEVRIARQVSHPNLCRVYDIGELDDQYFLTMEYIDGEDLASLLRRIGFLHGQKALDIARQLCAGLAAAHDKGVLHRDLKPANVMIDGRGRVRITDFGLALAGSETAAGDELSGTPLYMAPEQLAGQGASVRSDLYALGLVLYELYTGKKAFDAPTLAELRAQKASETPVAPSEITRDMDPVVERVILRCLEKDPRARPSSVAQLAAALPGGDPLAAALAAGETPSPEMVAAAGSSEGFSPRAAWLTLACLLISLAVTVPLLAARSLSYRTPLPKPPDVLAERARQILAAFGHTESPAASAYGFLVNRDLLDYVAEHEAAKDRWDRLPAEAIAFWYRQSASGPIMRVNFLGSGAGVSHVDPPLHSRGDVLVWLDPAGGLLELTSVPAANEDRASSSRPPDWTAVFRETGLDPSQWTPVPPQYVPMTFADQRMAWIGAWPGRPREQVRLEAGAHQGRLVSVARVGLWTMPGDRAPNRRVQMQGFMLLGIVAVLVVAAAILARRNVRLGRGDRRGATRVALVVFGLTLAGWVFGNEHVPHPWELMLAVMAVSRGLLAAALTWMSYLALEPFVRRRWPRVLVAWNRVLAGGCRDPLVARDMLGGSALMALAGVFGYGQFVLRLLVRKEWIAACVVAGVMSVVDGFSSPQISAVSMLFAFVAWIATVMTLLRFGLVGIVVGGFITWVESRPHNYDCYLDVCRISSAFASAPASSICSSSSCGRAGGSSTTPRSRGSATSPVPP
jgi:serine/threonine-protein kinase